MWTIDRLKEECQNLSNKFNDNFNVPITINNRLTTTLGRCRSRKINSEQFEPFELQFSKKFLEKSVDEDIISVIQHEWAHYYVTKITKEACGHNNRFKEICAAINCQNDQRVFKGIAPNSEKKFKYEVHCKNCKKVVAHYNRMCPTLRNIEYYQCSYCEGKELFFKQNW
jgi:predicted SprT family Zn-dependent metalloprotease